jgi:hypothetical protein
MWRGDDVKTPATLDGSLWELHLHLIKLARESGDAIKAARARRSADMHALARKLNRWPA